MAHIDSLSEEQLIRIKSMEVTLSDKLQILIKLIADNGAINSYGSNELTDYNNYYNCYDYVVWALTGEFTQKYFSACDIVESFIMEVK